MAAYFDTNNPNILLSEFKSKIDKKEVVMWKYDDDGDFTLTSEQWKNSAWFTPVIENSRLAMYMVPPKNKNISVVTYAVFHGRIAESMLSRCDSFFTSVHLSSFPEGRDKMESQA